MMSSLSRPKVAAPAVSNVASRDRTSQVSKLEFLRSTLVGVLLVFSLDTELQSVVPLLKSIEHTYHMSATEGAWALSATGIAAGATIPLLSRLGDIFGLRRLLLITLAIVAAGNVICALAAGPATFIFGRAIVGVNAGLPLYYAILRARSHRKEVADRFAGLVTLAIGCAVCVSFIYGGVVIQAGGSVRVALWIIAGISAALVLVVWRLVDEVPTRTRIGVDYLGGLLLGGGFAALVTAISEANNWGWGSTKVLCLLAGAVALFVVWTVWELRCAHPLIDVRVLMRREIWPGFTVAALASVFGVNGLLVVTTYIQTPRSLGYGLGASVLLAGVYLTPAGVMIAFGGIIIAPIIARVGQRTTVLIGGTLALALFLWASRDASSSLSFLALTAVLGICYSLVYTGGVSVYLRSARPGEQGMITGGARAAATALAAIGPALITTLLTASLIPGTPVPRQSNYGHVWLLWAGAAAIVLLAGAFIRETKLDDRPTDDVEVLTPRRGRHPGAADRPIAGGAS